MYFRTVDTSKFSTHVLAAVIAIDLAGNARVRVEHGIKWLNCNAPYDWRLQMISIHGGSVSSNVRLCRGDENPLALALRRVPELQGSDGRVLWANLLSLSIIGRHEAERCGFVEMSCHAPENVFIDETIDGMYLDEAWGKALGEYSITALPLSPYRQTPWPYGSSVPSKLKAANLVTA